MRRCTVIRGRKEINETREVTWRWVTEVDMGSVGDDEWVVGHGG